MIQDFECRILWMRIVCIDADSVSGSDFGRISVGFSQLKYDILADSRFECRSRGNSRDPRSSASMRTVRNFDCGYATRCPMYIRPVDHWFRYRYCVPCVLLPHVESGFVAESVCAVESRRLSKFLVRRKYAPRSTSLQWNFSRTRYCDQISSFQRCIRRLLVASTESIHRLSI